MAVTYCYRLINPMRYPLFFLKSIGAIALIAPLSYNNAAAQAASIEDPWRFSVEAYGYLPTVKGGSTFPNGNSGPSIKIQQKDVLSHLKFASMGKVGVSKGRWGAYIDVFYAELGDKVTASRDFTVSNISVPLDIQGDFKLRNKSMLLTLAGTYQLAKESNYELNALAGARLNYMAQSLDWRLTSPSDPGANLSGHAKLKKRYWDGIVGVAGKWHPVSQHPNFFVPFYADIGTGESRRTSQLMAGAGYQFKWGEVSAAWRYIDYKFKSKDLIHSLSYNGPMVGVTWRF